jgi:hypothetical protein
MIYSVSWVWLLGAALLAGAGAGVMTWTFFDQEIVAGVFAFLLVGLLAFAVPMAMRESRAYETWCSAQGGHVDSTSQVVSTVGADGKPSVGTSTTTFCLSADGRILDVQ